MFKGGKTSIWILLFLVMLLLIMIGVGVLIWFTVQFKF